MDGRFYPIPGIPEIIKCGIFPSLAMAFNLSIVSSFPTISSSKIGRYFSTLHSISKLKCMKNQKEDVVMKKAKAIKKKSRKLTKAIHKLEERPRKQRLPLLWTGWILTILLALLCFLGVV